MKFIAAAAIASIAAAVQMEEATEDKRQQIVYEPQQWVPAYARTQDTYWRPAQYGYQRQSYGYQRPSWGSYGRRSYGCQQPAQTVAWRKTYGRQDVRPSCPYNGWVAETHPNMRLLGALGRAPEYDVNTWQKASQITHPTEYSDVDYDASKYDQEVEACDDCGYGSCYSCKDDCAYGQCAKDACAYGQCGYGDCKKVEYKEPEYKEPEYKEKDYRRRAWWNPTTTVRPGMERARYGKAPVYAEARSYSWAQPAYGCAKAW